MATPEQVKVALRNAHNAGDVEAARRLAGIYKSMNEAPVMYEGRNVDDMSGPSKFLTGVGNKVLDLGRGAAQIAGVAGKKGFGSQQDIAESRALSNELGKSKSGMAGNIAGDVLPFMMTGGGSSIPGLAAKSAAMSALTPTVEGESRLKNAAVGGAFGGATGVAVKGLASIAKGFKPSADAASLMKQGVQPTVGQGIDQSTWLGKGIRKAEEATTSLPFAGAITKSARDRALKEGVKKVLSTAEDKTLGVSAKGAVGHDAVENLKQTFNEAYEKALAGHSIPIKPDFSNKIVSAVNDPSKFVNEPERKAIFSWLQGTFDKMTPDSTGKYLASDIHSVESALKAKARSLPFGDDKAQIYNEVKNVISKYRMDNLPTNVGDTIKKLDSKYLNYTRIKKAAEGVGAEHGEFSPAQIYNAATMMGKKSGQSSRGKAPLQKLAGELKSTLSDKLGDSGTAPRMLTNKLLLGGGLEAAAGGVNLPAYVSLMSLMGAGSVRPVQKALLGGYKGQQAVSEVIKKSGKPVAALSLAEMKRRNTKK